MLKAFIFPLDFFATIYLDIYRALCGVYKIVSVLLWPYHETANSIVCMTSQIPLGEGW